MAGKMRLKPVDSLPRASYNAHKHVKVLERFAKSDYVICEVYFEGMSGVSTTAGLRDAIYRCRDRFGDIMAATRNGKTYLVKIKPEERGEVHEKHNAEGSGPGGSVADSPAPGRQEQPGSG